MPFRLVGMVHLGPLPGSPRYDGDLKAVIERARHDAATLENAGFEAVLFENYEDAPFFADAVPPVTVAGMTRAITEVRATVDLPAGVNVLRNDSRAALAVAAACECQFIRVNVLTGVMFTDQGRIEGRAAETVRARTKLHSDCEIFADVWVKHATPPSGTNFTQTAAETWERGGADALIVTGTATGRATDLTQVERIRDVVPQAPVLIGSGVTADTVADALAVADGVIVGTSLKEAADITRPVDPQRAQALVAAARAT